MIAGGEHLLVVYNSGTMEAWRVGDEIERVAAWEDLTASEVWAHPALTDQELIIKDGSTLYSFTLRP